MCQYKYAYSLKGRKAKQNPTFSDDQGQGIVETSSHDEVESEEFEGEGEDAASEGNCICILN